MAKTPITARIDSLLAQKGVSKAQFYQDCAITSASYSQWNTGKTTPREKNLYRIAEYLGTTVEYLTGITENPDKEKEPTAINGDELTPVKREAYNLISQMSDEDLERFIRIARAILGD